MSARMPARLTSPNLLWAKHARRKGTSRFLTRLKNREKKLREISALYLLPTFWVSKLRCARERNVNASCR